MFIHFLIKNNRQRQNMGIRTSVVQMSNCSSWPFLPPRLSSWVFYSLFFETRTFEQHWSDQNCVMRINSSFQIYICPLSSFNSPSHICHTHKFNNNFLFNFLSKIINKIKMTKFGCQKWELFLRPLLWNSINVVRAFLAFHSSLWDFWLFDQC